MLPQSSIRSMQEHLVASERQVLPSIGVADLVPGDLDEVTRLEVGNTC